MLDYQTQAENDSMYNTPPCWSMYICGLVFAKMLEDGGLSAALENNKAKAKVCVGGLVVEIAVVLRGSVCGGGFVEGVCCV